MSRTHIAKIATARRGSEPPRAPLLAPERAEREAHGVGASDRGSAAPFLAPDGRGRPDAAVPFLAPDGRGRPDAAAPFLAPDGRGRPDAGTGRRGGRVASRRAAAPHQRVGSLTAEEIDLIERMEAAAESASAALDPAEADGSPGRDTLPEGIRTTARQPTHELPMPLPAQEAALRGTLPPMARGRAAFRQPDQPDQPDLIGAMLAERYQVESLLALGSVCEVFRARHMYLDRAVALKALRDPLPPGREGERDRLLREARALARLKHPHVVRIYDYGVTDAGRPYLVTELLEGATLEQLLGQCGSRLGLRRACRLGAQVARVMAELHALGLVLGGQAGGLKASNLLIEREGAPHGAPPLHDSAGADSGGAAGAERVRLVDLSGVQAAGPAGRRVLGLPELVDATGGIDATLRRRDERALGELLFRMLTGTPFAAAGANPGEDALQAARDRLAQALRETPDLPAQAALPDLPALPALPSYARKNPVLAALEELLLRALAATPASAATPTDRAGRSPAAPPAPAIDQGGVSARHLEQVLQQVAHLDLPAPPQAAVPGDAAWAAPGAGPPQRA